VLKSGTPYQDLGGDFYARRESPEHKQAWLERQLRKLHPGCAITISHHHHRPPGGDLNTQRLGQPRPTLRPRSRSRSRRPGPPAGQPTPARNLATVHVSGQDASVASRWQTRSA
jgi:hypothetical protein